MSDPIYLDCNATTPICPEARAAVIAAMDSPGNASSAHIPGVRAAETVAHARRQVADLLGTSDPASIVFTSGATEANNMALGGVAEAARRDGHAMPEIIVSAIEHSSVLAFARKLARRGIIRLVEVPVDASGIVRVEDVASRITPATVLVSVQGVNNEIGTIQPIDALGDLCAARRVLMHTDLCQSLGKIPFDVSKFDLASMSAHKLYGPTGVGALYGRPAVLAWLEPQTLGGGQEQGRRAGTLNAHGIAGFGAAAEAMQRSWCEGGEAMRLRGMRDRLLAALRAQLDLRVNGAIDAPYWEGGYGCALRTPHNLNVTLLGVDSKAFHAAVRDRVALSAGSACKALGGQRSHVLEAIGAPLDGAVVRMALGSCNDEAQLEEAARAIIEAAREARLLRGPAVASTSPQTGDAGPVKPSGYVAELAPFREELRNELRRLRVAGASVVSVGTGLAPGPTFFIYTDGDLAAVRRVAPAKWRSYPVEVHPLARAFAILAGASGSTDANHVEVHPSARAFAQRPAGEATNTITHGVRILGAPIGSVVDVGGVAAPEVPGMGDPTYLIPDGVQGPRTVRIVTPSNEVRMWSGDVPPAGEITLRFDAMTRGAPPSPSSPAARRAPVMAISPAVRVVGASPRGPAPLVRIVGLPPGASVEVNGVVCGGVGGKR